LEIFSKIQIRGDLYFRLSFLKCQVGSSFSCQSTLEVMYREKEKYK
jgi:hypothetical protein